MPSDAVSGRLLIIEGEAVALDAREPRELGDSPVTGKGNSVGSVSRALALPLRDPDRDASSNSSSTDERELIEVDVEDPDTNVDDDAGENKPVDSEPDELDFGGGKPGLRGWCAAA